MGIMICPRRSPEGALELRVPVRMNSFSFSPGVSLQATYFESQCAIPGVSGCLSPWISIVFVGSVP